jgi:transposase
VQQRRRLGQAQPPGRLDQGFSGHDGPLPVAAARRSVGDHPTPAQPGSTPSPAAITSLAFLARFGSQDAAAQLDEQAIGAWLATIAVRGRPAAASVLHARLRAAPPGATGADGAAQAGITAALTALSAQIKALETQIAWQLAAHPDRHVFTSLPRPGTVRAARLLAEIGDCRSRFPDPGSIAGLAGVAPVTRRSGTRIAHGFRWAVNRQLRDAVCDFAADSRHASPWAAAIYDDARGRGKDHPHAVRITARAWIYVIWSCWHDSTAYDPAKHNALQRILAQQETGPATQHDR